MAKARKYGRVLNILLDGHVHDMLDQFCKDTGYSKTGAVEQALRQFFKTEAEKQDLLLKQMESKGE